MSVSKNYDVIVVGGGPAGMLAALAAAGGGASAAIVEKNEKLGKKLYITGKGRCNVTNTARPVEDFLENVPRNPRFLYSAMAAMDGVALRELLAKHGTPTVEERGGRVFPASDKASDVTRALTRALEEAGVSVLLNAEVAGVVAEDGFAKGIRLANGETISAKAVVVATGGGSYPLTGSTGDGWRFAEELGLQVVRASASLVGIHTAESWPRTLQGITLKNVTLTAKRRGKRVYSEMGELLFTHFGISGPLALTLSSHITGSSLDDVTVGIDLKPGMTEQEVDERLLRELAASPRKAVATVLEGWLPKRMAAEFLPAVGLNQGLAAHEVTRQLRETLVKSFKALPITPAGLRPLGEAIITRGGVSVKAISSNTMEARAVNGLYFAGEVVDVDALTGGYNLQIAFSTGYLAGQSAAEQIKQNNEGE